MPVRFDMVLADVRRCFQVLAPTSASLLPDTEKWAKVVKFAGIKAD
jgi:hypothetical protein